VGKDAKKPKKNEKASILEKPLTRRDFIKGAVVGGVGLAIGVYTLNKLLSTPQPAPRPQKQGSPKVETGVGVEKLWRWSREGYYQVKLGENVQCQVCPNRCLLQPGQRSVCRVKTNLEGKIYTLAYGNPCAVHVDPVEKKPLFHFLPGTKAFSIATAGCNFRCLNCQNWTISQRRPEDTRNYDLMPEKVVEAAVSSGAISIAYTYSEPVAFYEYMLDTSRIAKKRGIKNIWVTNGYINKKPLLELCKYIDAANVDLKSFKESIYNRLNAGRLQPVLDTLKTLREAGTWFEVTNLVVPTWTDDLEMIAEMCEWLLKNLGPDYPLHFSRFHPHYKLTHLPPTPVDTLEKAMETAKETGINYVYIGNVPGHRAQNTFCPACNQLIIKRRGYRIIENKLVDGRCPHCDNPIPGVWKP